MEARLYKLLVYEKGGFFLPHRDSEKDDGMVASLIVVLANPFEGGALVVRHAHPTVAEAFCASRLAGDHGAAFGTLPPGIDCESIVARALPVAA